MGKKGKGSKKKDDEKKKKKKKKKDDRPYEKPSALTRTEPQTQEMRSEAIWLCRPNRMMRPRRYSGKTILICKCPAHG
jgi:hypothetical protein